MGRGVLVALGILFGTQVAEAQTPVRLPAIDFRRSPVSTDPNASIYLEPAATQGHLVWNVGIWGSYLNRLITLEEDVGDETVGRPVRHQMGVDVVASLGLTDRLAFGVLLPFIAWQEGDETRVLVTDGEELPSFALSDLALTGKVTIVRPGPLGGFSLAALGRVTFPTGDTRSFASEPTSTGTIRLLGELSLVALSVRASAGGHLRPYTREYAGLDMQYELPWGLGVQFKPQVLGIDDAGRHSWNLEARGSMSLAPGFSQRRESTAMIGISWRTALGPFALTAGAELPLASAAGTPSVRALLGVGFSPITHDVDKDGIEDERDECAELAEDKDGFEDSDGCPDFDNDDDGIPDENDRCPNEKEDEDGFQDDDGCPELDNDGDGVRDALDQCPSAPGPVISGAPGCPTDDADRDGIYDALDRCPKEAEDPDGFEDTDGCPDTDNDGDGVPDATDACPMTPGLRHAEASVLGCPSPDRDGDTFADNVDVCPDQPENFDGRMDTDGCPETGAPRTPLARWDVSAERRLVLSERISFGVNESTPLPRSEPILRAIASLLAQDKDVVLRVGVKADASGEELARERAGALVEFLLRQSRRADAAEVVDWTTVEGSPSLYGNVGFVVSSRAGAR